MDYIRQLILLAGIRQESCQTNFTSHPQNNKDNLTTEADMTNIC